MNSLELHLILTLAILLQFVSPAICQSNFSAYSCVDDYGIYATNSTYEANLHRLLSSVTSNNKTDYGFYNVSTGINMDKVHGVALCRGDVPTPDCKTCIRNATKKITTVCANQDTAVGWYENCMIWYSNQNIFKGVAFSPYYNLTSTVDPLNPKSYNQTVSTLMMGLANKAALGDSRLKFATGEANVTNKLTVYALVQCIPDLQNFDCLNCLQIIINFTLAGCCYGKEGATVAVPSCNIRFENYRFYKSAIVLPPLLSSSPPPFFSVVPPFESTTSKTEKGHKGTRIAIITVAATVSSLALLVILVGCYLRNSRKRALGKVESGQEDMEESLQLNFSVVKAATDNFSDSNKLGQGGFGTVYKGKLSITGKEVAVKRLSKNSGQGEQQFKNEALLVAKLQHRNLVRLYGFSIKKDERLLIYEFLPNNSLDDFLFDPTKRRQLDWQQRYKIIGGIARGLLYLHEESRLLVVHRDLKASNVLLDAEMNPKISDFGMARLFGADQSHANTSKIAGTYGYMPPEYLVHGHFSIKSDVFSFGVLVLEIISGQKVSKFSEAENGESLLSLVWRNWSEGNALKLVDSAISAVHPTEVLRCIHIGLLCVQENAARRPIMSSVVLMLNSNTVSLPMPSRPAFLVQNNIDSDALFMEHNIKPLHGSVNEVSLSNLYPR